MKFLFSWGFLFRLKKPVLSGEGHSLEPLHLDPWRAQDLRKYQDTPLEHTPSHPQTRKDILYKVVYIIMNNILIYTQTTDGFVYGAMMNQYMGEIWRILSSF